MKDFIARKYALFSMMITFILLSGSVHGQLLIPKSDKDLIQFSGIIRNLQHRPVSDANIIILNRERGTTADRRGIFSFS